MKTLITALVFLFSTTAFAQSAYEKGMQQGLTLWKSDKSTEAAAQFERVSQVEKENWIPVYYQALVLTTSAFATNDMEEKATLISSAQHLLENSAQENNSEWLTLKAMNLIADLTTDPMTKAKTLSPTIMALYEKAIQLDPTNPRAAMGIAEFQMGSKKYFNQDISKECEAVKKALNLFEVQKSTIPFAPTWGKERAEQIIQNCGK
ncbi:hypothetical protein LZQ00_16215 [Sphingobacterium sp. SRCM116780]|uniref:hypothetical protein n=1 Tax=Sphingobacterium sp. SRCM116780 TaxID=2907623 RepID=UPI001F34D7B4|nr:hypothetical protein [Sphingobacterium sp. SRCM116780]UIR55798.1 hypothetical protein LZQ00_16215 [Sphingobacterium sp. SRCM116780]